MILIHNAKEAEQAAAHLHSSLPPLDPLQLQFASAFSDALFQDPVLQKSPESAALAFWLREGHLQALTLRWKSTLSKDELLAPRGIVWHIPPATIDAMGYYSWVLSLLGGNCNIIRLPRESSEIGARLFSSVSALLEKFPEIKRSVVFVRYGHDEEINAAFSRLADVRVIFGGDETVNYFRRLPLKPTGKEVVFPDRFSYAAIRASSYLQKTKEERQVLANRFFLDSYTFDQSACSSPKLLFWIGDQEKVALAATSFYEFLEKEIEQRRFTLSDGGSVLKWSYLFDQSLHKEVTSLIRGPGALSVVALSKPENFCRVHCGQGLFYHIALSSLEEIYPFVEAKDQTLTYDGFSVEELRALASCLNGKGITRMVPIGQALDFSPLWDGQDLFVELTQKIGVYG